MNVPFALKLAWRESRSSVRRLGVYMTAITLGVAALVAINSFRAGVIENVRDEARRLLGADIELSSGRPFPDSVQTVIDSVAAAGTPLATITATVSVALAENGNTRFIQLRAIDGGFPFYGEYLTEPAGMWARLQEDRTVLVEASLLETLDVEVGDALRLGEVAFRIAGVVTNLPADFAFRSAIGPRVYIGGQWLAETGLIRFGSMVDYHAYLAMPDAAERDAFMERHRAEFRAAQVRSETAEEEAEDIARAMDTLARFLGLVGLAALLLGGLGVASAVDVFVKEKRPAIAVLRCIGATQRTAFIAYLLQAALLGLAGAAAGALLGLGLQAAIPPLLAELLPVQTTFSVHPAPILAGLAVGVAVATLFALLPLLEIRGISPLQALRYDIEHDLPAAPAGLRERIRKRKRDPEAEAGYDAGSKVSLVRRVDPWRAAAWVVLLTGITLIAVIQADELWAGTGFAAGIAAALLLLRAAASLLMRAARRWFPRRAGFVVRQGIAGLFRPRNQTAAVTVALGFGVFVVATLWLVQRSLLTWLEVDEAAEQPNLVVFDIQPDQRDDVTAILARHSGSEPQLVPIVPARIAAIRGTPVDVLLQNPDSAGIERWALRREYRNTYRAGMTESEELLAGEWWSTGPEAGGGDGAPARISIEADVAQDLGVALGDHITWNFQGVHVETVITSIRRVDWARIDTNFFVVFEPGAIDAAPQTYVTLAHIEEPAQRASVQRDLARAHSNVLSIDIALLRETLARIVDRVITAIRFMAGFGVAAGLIVLAGAIRAARFQRVRESALLRTLGATRAQIRRILLTEYLALGTMAALAGGILAIGAAWALVTFFFDLDFALPILPLLAGIAFVAAAAAALGMASSREALRGTPLAVLREGG